MMNAHTTAGTAPGHTRMTALEDTAVQWTGGFWFEKFETTKDRTLPGMLEALRDPNNGAYLGNFSLAASGQQEHHATFWSDGDCYKFLQALAHVYATSREEPVRILMDEIIADIAGAQQSDGYINTQITETSSERWVDLRKHEHYNLGHLFTAAATHNRITGQTNLLDIATKAADCVYGVFASRPRELAHYEFNPSNIMGLVELYEVTGDGRYLELANTFVEMRGSAEGGIGDCNQDRVPLRSETRAYGHAVTATYLYAGAADVVAHTGDAGLMQALKAIWDDVTQRKLYITGGTGALHVGVSERTGGPDNADMVWEAFGDAFKLPNASAYNETCANIGMAMWGLRMLQLTGDVKYADVAEMVLYNAGISGVSLDGTEFTYTNPLRWHGNDHSKYVSLTHDSPQRWNRWDCYCCPPQIARTISGLSRWAVSRSDTDLWIHLFGGSRVRTQIGGGDFAYEMRTDYPWDGKIDIVVETAPEASVGLNIRIPGWAKGASVLVNGELQAGVLPGTFFQLRRHWKASDQITLELPLMANFVVGHHRVEEVTNQVAVVRGPVVYCLEARDLPDGVALKDVFISPSHRFELSTESVGNARMLTGQAIWRPSTTSEHLYQTLEVAPAKPINLRLVPYFAWNNRGVTEMSVWLPVAIHA